MKIWFSVGNGHLTWQTIPLIIWYACLISTGGGSEVAYIKTYYDHLYVTESISPIVIVNTVGSEAV